MLAEEEVGPFAWYDDPEALLAAECAVVEEVAGELRRLGYRHLGRLLAVTPVRGQPLLAMAAQYYFRRAVGDDPVLARELNWVKLTALDRRLEAGLALLALIQERYGQRLEEALEHLARVEMVGGRDPRRRARPPRRGQRADRAVPAGAPRVDRRRQRLDPG
jgi:hypothetical protein